MADGSGRETGSGGFRRGVLVVTVVIGVIALAGVLAAVVVAIIDLAD